jgi:hypothetical protein
MITLYLRYTIDPNKLSDFATYAAKEQIPISESGGKIAGHYLPTDFAGATSEAFGLIDLHLWPTTRCIVQNWLRTRFTSKCRRVDSCGRRALHTAFIDSARKTGEGAAAMRTAQETSRALIPGYEFGSPEAARSPLSGALVPSRYLLAFIPVVTDVRRFFENSIHDPSELTAIERAWTKSVHLHVVLWSRPYTREGLW